MAVLFISHNMQHVVEVCDRAIVLRHGRKVGDVSIASVTARDLMDLITGPRRALSRTATRPGSTRAMTVQAVQLAKARDAFHRGNLRRAFRHAWTAGTTAAGSSDTEVLGAVVELAKEIGVRAEARLRKDADELAVFASASLANAEAGIRPASALGGLFPRRLEPLTKARPDCAERVKKAARVCRFCGHRFDAT